MEGAIIPVENTDCESKTTVFTLDLSSIRELCIKYLVPQSSFTKDENSPQAGTEKIINFGIKVRKIKPRSESGKRFELNVSIPPYQIAFGTL